MISKHYKLYISAEINYINKNKNKKMDDLFPIEWYKSLDYVLKTKIIAEALKNNILVQETNLYKELFQTQKSR